MAFKRLIDLGGQALILTLFSVLLGPKPPQYVLYFPVLRISISCYIEPLEPTYVWCFVIVGADLCINYL